MFKVHQEVFQGNSLKSYYLVTSETGTVSICVSLRVCGWVVKILRPNLFRITFNWKIGPTFYGLVALRQVVHGVTSLRVEVSERLTVIVVTVRNE